MGAGGGQGAAGQLIAAAAHGLGIFRERYGLGLRGVSGNALRRRPCASIIAAVGTGLKAGPEREPAAHYAKRVADAGRGIGLREIEIVEIK